MTRQEPITTLHLQYSSPGTTATPWAVAVGQLEGAEIFWLSTVRPDRRPHVTPLPAIWLDGALYFCTGAEERKAKNLAQNAHCILTTGQNHLNQEGLDLAVEGDAVRVTEPSLLQQLAERYEAKYGSAWHYEVHNGAFVGSEANVALVFAVQPITVFGFGKGAQFSQTRWQFS